MQKVACSSARRSETAPRSSGNHTPGCVSPASTARANAAVQILAQTQGTDISQNIPTSAGVTHVSDAQYASQNSCPIY